MHNYDTAIDAWLGETAMTDEQRDRFVTVWDDVADRYPDDQTAATAALSAAVQYILGETTTVDVGRAMGSAAAALVDAKAAARAVALLAADEGVSEYALHQELNITRKTLRIWLGK